eukprot:GHVU01231301.1.p1 GENE.GHVU01231301.1~~GHVU01231301.1.p1  ORF type:complete len:627 (+),score=69.85 GHVU01231301.1:242-2122(+)
MSFSQTQSWLMGALSASIGAIAVSLVLMIADRRMARRAAREAEKEQAIPKDRHAFETLLPVVRRTKKPRVNSLNPRRRSAGGWGSRGGGLDVEDMITGGGVAPCGSSQCEISTGKCFPSMFAIFKIGCGPSSSHTNGPMWAAHNFMREVRKMGRIELVSNIKTELFGSLALTGKGHGTDKATVLGLQGNIPPTIEPDIAEVAYNSIISSHKLDICLTDQPNSEKKTICFLYERDMVFNFDTELPEHPNAMTIYAKDKDNQLLHLNTYLSIGGGAVMTLEEFKRREIMEEVDDADGDTMITKELLPCISSVPGDEISQSAQLPYPFESCSQLLKLCHLNNKTITEVMVANEMALRPGKTEEDIMRRLDDTWQVMQECIDRGLTHEGHLPVSGIARKAKKLHQRILARPEAMLCDSFSIMDWVSIYARAVNEENACGGRVVTAPTNGAAGVIPAVIAYYIKFIPGASREGIRDFLCCAAAIGALYKMNASISGAEVGCQGEVGVACSMASGALAAVLGGSLSQIENAAEIGMEHNLGMTCDPLGGLVQVPCIERNCVAAVTAITSCRLAMQNDGHHEISLDSCIATMYQTGLDIQSKYRETSRGGLALLAKKPTLLFGRNISDEPRAN